MQSAVRQVCFTFAEGANQSIADIDFLIKRKVFSKNSDFRHLRRRISSETSTMSTGHGKDSKSDKKNLLNDSTFSDFKIICEDKTFDCHKCILANQSDVLKIMLLSKDWSENQEDTLKIEGFEPDVVEKVNFIMKFE
jgi:hypothetical protein